MCGIFGIILKPGSNYPEASLKGSLKKIALFSESRGKDSSGIAFRNVAGGSIDVIKGDIPVSSLIRDNRYHDCLGTAMKYYTSGNGFSVFGHARLVTNGSQLHEVNNQPVIKDDILVIHNGIIVNVDEIWEKHPELKREYSIDTEIIPALIRKGLDKGNGLIAACNAAFSELAGTYSLAMLFADSDEFVFATNNGSFYYITDDENYFVFASESYFLDRLLKERPFSAFGGDRLVKPLAANQGVAVNMSTLSVNLFSTQELENLPVLTPAIKPLHIHKQLLENKDARYEVVIDPSVYMNRSKLNQALSLLEYNTEAVKNLKRCTKCILPETFPFISFDEKGVCNYCNNYIQKNQAKPESDLLDFIKPYRALNNQADCLIPFSGGRDSSFTLHYVKEHLGLNPIAFTYDWGMVTDLARRNAARICGKLGVENIIVAADIRFKRENIRKNVSAWLKRPQLGMIPLFMAGDKYFFYYSNKILSENNIKLSIWGANPLENTDFKSGFTGIKPHFDKKRIDELKIFNKAKLATYFAKNYIQNPSYFNSSLFNTMGSFLSRYLIKRQGFIQLFDFLQWDEAEIENLLLNEYNWEKSIDTKSTWRIGDGTAAFYNYIYFTVAGFSEFDTFRSNQIREGQMTREMALNLVSEENRPRYENLHWYLDIIGLDFKDTIVQINNIQKLYSFERKQYYKEI
jgi:glutamine---fructose-6-phosphate transaminase (isomerizing)